MSYDGANQAILCLQMRLMGWDVDIVHRTNNYLGDANYWSCLNADLCCDPSFQRYLHFVAELRKKHPPPTDHPMQAANMPYYWVPRILSKHCPARTSTDTMMQKLMARQRNTWMQSLLPSSAPSSCRVTRETLACVIGHSNLVASHQAITRALFMLCIIPNFQHSLISPCTLLGRFMGSMRDTFHLPFPNGIFQFRSLWRVIPTRPTVHPFRSLYHLVLQFYPAQHPSLITFVDRVTNGRLMGI
jgi:hypothetical protein